MNERQKELKLQYKEQKTKMGVFAIKNLANGKIFIKKTTNLKTANGLFFQLDHNSHLNKQLQQEWNQYGRDQFIIEILEELDPEKVKYSVHETLTKMEEKWIEQLSPYGEKGYHSSPKT
jgi:hypothetical protein